MLSFFLLATSLLSESMVSFDPLCGIAARKETMKLAGLRLRVIWTLPVFYYLDLHMIEIKNCALVCLNNSWSSFFNRSNSLIKYNLNCFKCNIFIGIGAAISSGFCNDTFCVSFFNPLLCRHNKAIQPGFLFILKGYSPNSVRQRKEKIGYSTNALRHQKVWMPSKW